ncbi:response regulator [Clostridium sp. 19966]|uniref:response regulator transcription factor n=1 Tax=Clostridium sp. 19966 TaxID=2768166 RepID=UPI0028DE9193|nr:response regulator [Clostridium sp. 19966]MDT8717267.1 response regulator [Clostridium sp. 19966]
MLKVIIVDDEPFVREGMKSVISWGKYDVKLCGEAEDGEEALKLIKEINPDIVITDIRMPEMSGLELIEKAKKELGSKAEFIILSGYTDFKYAQKAIKSNVFNYLLKPIDEDELVKVILEIKERIKQNAESNEENSLIENLINGKKVDNLNYSAYKNILNSKIRYIYLEIDVLDWLEDLNEVELKEKLRELEESIYRVIHRENINCIYQEQIWKYGIILCDEILKYYKSVENFAEALYKNISNNITNKCIVIVGKEVGNINDLIESYISCNNMKQYKYFYDKETVIYYDDIKKVESKYYDGQNLEVEDLSSAIEQGDNLKIFENINNIFKNIKEHNISPDIVKAYFIVLVLNVISNITEKNGNTDDFMNMFETIKYMKDMGIGEMQDNLVKFSIASSKYIKSMKSTSQGSGIYEIAKYIDNNYNQQDISLKKLAEIFYINPVYLGQLFKKSFGMYFNDYLHSKRIEEAKKLLRRSDLKLYEIAIKVGYSDANYFISKFEKITHFTPTQYKNSK